MLSSFQLCSPSSNLILMLLFQLPSRSTWQNLMLKYLFDRHKMNQSDLGWNESKSEPKINTSLSKFLMALEDMGLRGDIHTHVATQNISLTGFFKHTYPQWKRQPWQSKTVSLRFNWIQFNIFTYKHVVFLGHMA